MTVATAIFLRDREVLEQILTPVAAGNLCTNCRQPIAQGRFHWLDDDGQPQRGQGFYAGEIMSFTSWRHTDGTPGRGCGSLVLPARRCPECGAFDSIKVRDTGYGSDCTCTACGWNEYFDRGD